ncbi:MAG: hypothetical protein M3321_13000 [Actinomycetota bacterium]|nr:hypothetical protein [Actinomycetota bacterium]
MSEHADQFEEREEDDVSQYEQENDLGSGGGEVDDETMDDAEQRSGEGGDEPREDEPRAKLSSGDADEI